MGGVGSQNIVKDLCFNQKLSFILEIRGHRRICKK